MAKKPNRKVNFCTLFDAGYLERGLALYRSLEQYCKNFTLYVVAFGDDCYRTLSGMKLPYMEVISLEQLEGEELRKAKSNRSARAYFWTCSAWTIEYILENYDVLDCTYVDADEYFYQDPTPLLQGFWESNASVGISPHAFGEEPYNSRMIESSGKYCVQFNSFKQDELSRRILHQWCLDCAEKCEEFGVGKQFGDQGYVEVWPDEYPGAIYEYNELGAGVAPWNLYRYDMAITPGKGPCIRDSITEQDYPLYFVHFHNLVYNGEYFDLNIYTRYGRHSRKLVNRLYEDYIAHLLECRREIRKWLPDMYHEKFTISGTPDQKERFSAKIHQKGFWRTISESSKYRAFKRKDYWSI